MSIKKLLAFVVVVVCMVCCGKPQPMTFKSVTSRNQAYSLEIPNGFVEYKCHDDLLSYNGNDNHTLISIMEMPAGESLSGYTDRLRDNSFTYDYLTDSPTTIIRKMTRGTNMWSAYEFYGTKDVNGTTYLVKISSDTMSKGSLEEAFNHMIETLN